MTSYPLVRRTLATLRIAEFGFLGVRVMTWRHTPRRNGEFSKAGDLDLLRILFRPFRTSWLIVGMTTFVFFRFRPQTGQTERGCYQRAFRLQLVFVFFYLVNWPRAVRSPRWS